MVHMVVNPATQIRGLAHIIKKSGGCLPPGLFIYFFTSYLLYVFTDYYEESKR